jgi:hypothetical protein
MGFFSQCFKTTTASESLLSRLPVVQIYLLVQNFETGTEVGVTLGGVAGVQL